MCDTMCALGPGGTLFAKNSDRPITELQPIRAHPRRPGGGTLQTTYLEMDDPGALALLGAGPDWMWGLEHGVNERGVAIGNEEVFTIDDPASEPAALTGMDLVRLGLERARDAEDALEIMTALLAQHGQGGVANRADDAAYFSSFLIADARSAWILETSARTWAARPVEDGDSISNELTIRTDWTRSSPEVEEGADFGRWRNPSMWRGHAKVRRAATRRAARREEPITPADLVAVLRDHGTGPWGRPLPGGLGDQPGVKPLPPVEFDPATGEGFSVCFHVRNWQATTSSMVVALPADPAQLLRAWIAPGSPCASIFVPVFPPSDLPEALASTRWIARFASIARRVEEDGAARLEEVRAVLGPLERALWEEADDLVTAGATSDPDRRAAFMGSSWSRITTALEHLTRTDGTRVPGR